MSTAAYNRIMSLHGYEHALKYLNAIAPIRGRLPVVRPLGGRRDVNRFSIRMVGDADSLPEGSYYRQMPGSQYGDIECLLYDRPVVVFHKPKDGDDPNTARISVAHMSTWLPISHCYFIHNVLYKYFASVQRAHKSVAKLVKREGDTPIVFPCPTKDGGVTTLEMIVDKNDGKVLMVKGAPVEGLKLNRKATNIVRARYGQFYRYAKGMIALRREKDQYDDRYWLRINPAQFMAVGLTLTKNGLYVSERRNPAAKPAKGEVTRHYDFEKGRSVIKEVEVYPLWEAEAKQFIELIATPDTDQNQTEKFANAFTLLCLYTRLNVGNPYIRGIRADQDFEVVDKDLSETLDEIVFKYHSSEVIESYLMPEGYVPNPKYKTWVDR